KPSPLPPASILTAPGSAMLYSPCARRGAVARARQWTPAPPSRPRAARARPSPAVSRSCCPGGAVAAEQGRSAPCREARPRRPDGRRRGEVPAPTVGHPRPLRSPEAHPHGRRPPDHAHARPRGRGQRRRAASLAQSGRGPGERAPGPRRVPQGAGRPGRVTMPDLHYLTVSEAGELLRRREVSSLELTRAVLDRIDAVDGRVRAYVTVTADLALEQARAADERLARGEAGPLTGIPACIKDLIVTRGVRTTCSSKMLANFVPPYDAAVMERLNAAGVVMVGKSNMDEFAMGSSTESSAFFPTHNPWDLGRVPGGSSGGSAAATAAGECLFALGSDTGGSIRQPAALCGVVGVKPTYGRISRFGLVAFASSLDQIGPFARSVRDAATVLNAICGHDPLDSTSAPVEEPDFSAALSGEVRGLRVGVPREYFVEGMDA